MNLTLFHVVPMDESVRPMYVLAPDLEEAAQMVRHYIPRVLTIAAVANNAYQGDLFPRFEAWEPPPKVERHAYVPHQDEGSLISICGQCGRNPWHECHSTNSSEPK